MMRTVTVGDLTVGGGVLVLVAGPCVIESESHTLKMAASLRELTAGAGVPLVFKASYDKGNRTSVDSFRGPGLDAGLRILERVRSECGIPVLADVHSEGEVDAAAEVLDVLQTPAYLCRQTDLLTAVGRTGKPVNVKKAQFLAPWDMRHVVDKIRSVGNPRILLTERGTCFGYNQLVSDMRSLVHLAALDCPVLFDATHSVQVPGGMGKRSGGQREFVLPLARAAVAVGVDGVFVEVHDRPERALSDGPNSLALEDVPVFLEQVVRLHRYVDAWRVESRGSG